MSDLTLISKITNEAINENLKKRFENAEIYVGFPMARRGEGERGGWRVGGGGRAGIMGLDSEKEFGPQEGRSKYETDSGLTLILWAWADIHWTCVNFDESVQRL